MLQPPYFFVTCILPCANAGKTADEAFVNKGPKPTRIQAASAPRTRSHAKGMIEHVVLRERLPRARFRVSLESKMLQRAAGEQFSTVEPAYKQGVSVADKLRATMQQIHRTNRPPEQVGTMASDFAGRVRQHKRLSGMH